MSRSSTVLCGVALLLVSQPMSAGQRYESLVRFSATDPREEFTFRLGRDLVLTVTQAVDAQNHHFGWDLSITDRRLRHSPNFFYGCLCGHGPRPNDLYAWHFRTDEFPSERDLPVWGYPYEVRATCHGCTVAGGAYMSAFFTGGTVEIGWRRLVVANQRQLHLSDVRSRDAPKGVR